MKSYRLQFETNPTVFEDNLEDLNVATWPRFTPTNNFILVKYHLFRQHVDSGDIYIKKVYYQ